MKEKITCPDCSCQTRDWYQTQTRKMCSRCYERQMARETREMVAGCSNLGEIDGMIRQEESEWRKRPEDIKKGGFKMTEAAESEWDEERQEDAA